MKKTTLILVALTMAVCLLMCACGGVDSGKVKDTTQGVNMTTTQNITTDTASTTHITDALTSALTDASKAADDLLSTTANASVTQ